ncbi:MAG TPA: hypothetical protein VNW94_21235 [Streptosporangiaceae bacterium]|nr:hypothetical protein [Streptosporangiaceae bacterium]
MASVTVVTAGAAGRRSWRLYPRLRLMLGTAMVLTALLWIAVTVPLLEARTTIAFTRDRAIPSYLGALTAHAALSDADRSAWLSFRSGEAQLIGPGQRYQDDITTAGQNLEHLAELDTAGPEGRQLLRAVNGQLVTYQGLVEQADASYREGDRPLGFAYLTYATTSLHNPGGLLSRVDQIGELDHRAVASGQNSVWVRPGVLLLPAIVAVLLLGFLVLVQVYVALGFRRTINLPLVAACVLLIGLTAGAFGAMIHSGQAFQTAESRALPALTGIWRAQIGGADVGTTALRAGRTAGSSGGLDVAATEPAQQRLDSGLAAAANTGGLVVVLPVLALGVAGLAALGLQLRLHEFRG